MIVPEIKNCKNCYFFKTNPALTQSYPYMSMYINNNTQYYVQIHVQICVTSDVQSFKSKR